MYIHCSVKIKNGKPGEKLKGRALVMGKSLLLMHCYVVCLESIHALIYHFTLSYTT